MTTQQRQKPQITRYAIFTVGEANPNEYGDLIVKDTQGNEYKIGNKRERLFEVFQIGAEVKVGYAVYMQKEYIASAEQTGKHLPIVEAIEKAGAKVKSATVEEKMTKDDWKERDKITRTSIQRQTALKEANLQTLKQIELNPKIAELKSPEIAQVTINVAKIFEKYLDGD